MKASATLGGVPLAATSSIGWKLVAGVQPYQAIYSVRTEVWESSLSRRRGQPLDLVITDARGVETKVQGVYILNEAPSSRPRITSFVVSDRRYKWAYELVVRDYNIRKRTGDLDRRGVNLPIEQQVTIEEFDYRTSSLNRGERWTAKAAVEDILEQLEPGKFRIESFPTTGDEQFPLQNVELRDRGDVALSRLLSNIPGASVYVDQEDRVIVFDAADLDAAESLADNLPPTTWRADKLEDIDRSKIRPSEVHVYFQREIEVLLSYEDDYGAFTVTRPDRNSPYIENVVQTVDDETTVTEFDPIADRFVTKTVPAGTWVEFSAWLRWCNANRPTRDGQEIGLPWTFRTIRAHWLQGDLDGALGNNGADLTPNADVALRVAAIRQHFRQSFRVNRRYSERYRDFLAIRAALIDPVSGARTPAAVYGQAALIPTTKGKLIASRRDPDNFRLYINVDHLPKDGQPLSEATPSPADVRIADRDLGIFRLSWNASPYGTVGSYVPCNLVSVDEQGNETLKAPSRDLAEQDTEPLGPGTTRAGFTNGIYLADSLEYKIVVTMVPSAPNNRRQFERIVVKPDEIRQLYRTEFRIQDGDGPILRYFVPPGEASARFILTDDTEAAEATFATVFGLDSDDPNDAGIPEGADLPGLLCINRTRELEELAKAIAAEQWASFADSRQGTKSSVMPRNGRLRLLGNIGSASVQISAAPSAVVEAVHEFPGQQQPIGRIAFLPAAARRLLLQIPPPKDV